MKLTEELSWRGFVNQTTIKDTSILDGEPIRFYWGVDPSADSMQIGNLAIAIMVRHFMAHGHQAVLLVGGATGLIGDPDGKADERSLISQEQVAANAEKIASQYQSLFAGMTFEIVNNYDWFKDYNYLSFLRDVGKHVPLRQMVGREFVQNRLGENGSGISYAEFSYVLIQAYDFLHLHRSHGVTLQVCGADQWGNSIAGVDLTRRVTGDEVHVWSAPLVLNKSTGKKFGKTEDGAVWLDAAKTSPYQFYQFWLNVDDEGVGDYMKIYTLLDRPTIEAALEAFDADRRSRSAQKLLAYEVTKLVHGQDQADRQVHIADAISAQSLDGLSDDELNVLRQEISSTNAQVGEAIGPVLVRAGLASSNTEAQRLLRDNAISINGAKVIRDEFVAEDFLAGKMLIRRGKAYKDTAFIEQT